MSKLENTVARRGGKTASNWYETINNVALNTSKEELRIGFSMSSKGGGDTEVQVAIRSGDFGRLLAAMIAVDRQAALETMSIQLTKQLASPPALYQEFERSGELRVYRAAQAKYRAKPRGERNKESIVYDGVSEIVFPIGTNDAPAASAS